MKIKPTWILSENGCELYGIRYEEVEVSLSVHRNNKIHSVCLHQLFQVIYCPERNLTLDG
jgi:hypothetical protein